MLPTRTRITCIDQISYDVPGQDCSVPSCQQSNRTAETYFNYEVLGRRSQTESSINQRMYQVPWILVYEIMPGTCNLWYLQRTYLRGQTTPVPVPIPTNVYVRVPGIFVRTNGGKIQTTQRQQSARSSRQCSASQGPTLSSPCSAPPLPVAIGRALAFFSPCPPAPSRSQASQPLPIGSSLSSYAYSYSNYVYDPGTRSCREQNRTESTKFLP